MRPDFKVMTLSVLALFTGGLAYSGLPAKDVDPAIGERTRTAAEEEVLEVELIDRDGARVGTAQLSVDTLGVRIRVEAVSLPPGERGFHIHERGACEGPDFESAGSHYAPEPGDHGFLNGGGPHAGDLPMVDVDVRGTVAGYDFTTDRVGLSAESLLGPEGSSLIVHAETDDYRTDDGAGGDRIACGVISAPRG